MKKNNNSFLPKKRILGFKAVRACCSAHLKNYFCTHNVLFEFVIPIGEHVISDKFRLTWGF